MTAIFIEGFETHQDFSIFARKYSLAIMDGGITFPSGRVAGSCLGASTGASSWLQLVPPSPTYIVGFGIRGRDMLDGIGVLTFGDGPPQVMIAALDTANGYTLDAYRGNKVSHLGATPELLNDQWYYVEVKVTIGSSTGSVIIKVNEAIVLNLTNINTAGVGTPNISSIGFFVQKQGTANARMELDDIYVVNSLVVDATSASDFQGDTYIEGRVPNGEGDSLQWTPSAAGTHFSMVDEANVADDDATYVQTPTNGNIDLYQFQDLQTTTGNIWAVQLNLEARLLAAGSRNIRHKHKHTSGAVHEGANVAVATTAYKNYAKVWEGNPATAAFWTVADVQGAQFGVEAVA